MTLADLFAALTATGTLLRAKDKKTALRYLAAALGHASLEACPVDAACREPDRWGAALEAHFTALTAQGRTISASTRRNTRNDLRVLFRQAEAHGLLQAPLPPRLLTKPQRFDFRRLQLETAPYKSTYRHEGTHSYGLPRAQWPPEIQAGWRAYRAKCGLRLREASFRSYEKRMATYLGYLTTIGGPPPTWDIVFDAAQLTEFVRWHAARVERPLSSHGFHLVCMLAAMAKVLEHPASRALTDLSRTLKQPAPIHSKRAHWVSLAQLEAVAEACLAEGRAPRIIHNRDTKYPGAQRASRFQRGLILKLLVRIPLRQRNLREMRLGQHLYQDQAGHWQLHFQGGDLKVGTRGGRVNEYNVNLTEYAPECVPLLEEFLREYRPRFPHATDSTRVFLTIYGNSFTQQTLRVELAETVAMRTGQRFYPHLIRTIWATEYLEATQDFTTAATMLGDTLQMVMKTYYDIIHRDQHAKARAFLGTALHTG